MPSRNQQKPMSEWTNKEWRGFIIALTFIGIFMFFIGLKDGNWNITSFGLIMVAVGVAGGFLLHFFFGIKIIDMRSDFKHKKRRKR